MLLTNLDGSSGFSLLNLQNVTGYFQIIQNKNLAELSLPQLFNFNSYVDFTSNNNLQSLVIPNLNKVGGYLNIANNQFLKTLQFDNLISVGSFSGTSFTIMIDRGSLNIGYIETLYFPMLTNISGPFKIDYILSNPQNLKFVFCSLVNSNIGGNITINMDTSSVCCAQIADIQNNALCNATTGCGVNINITGGVDAGVRSSVPIYNTQKYPVYLTVANYNTKLLNITTTNFVIKAQSNTTIPFVALAKFKETTVILSSNATCNLTFTVYNSNERPDFTNPNSPYFSFPVTVIALLLFSWLGCACCISKLLL